MRNPVSLRSCAGLLAIVVTVSCGAPRESVPRSPTSEQAPAGTPAPASAPPPAPMPQQAPQPPAVQGSAPTEQADIQRMVIEFDQARAILEASRGDCATACRALASMERAVRAVCRLEDEGAEGSRC